ncbi:MAG: hypothetical protein HS126_40200 [Anaerolineales bacterium]|nr:hypothetical protein [Anaerolineales bacterium]
MSPQRFCVECLFNQDGRILASSSGDSTIILWDMSIESGKRVLVLSPIVI